LCRAVSRQQCRCRLDRVSATASAPVKEYVVQRQDIVVGAEANQHPREAAQVQSLPDPKFGADAAMHTEIPSGPLQLVAFDERVSDERRDGLRGADVRPAAGPRSLQGPAGSADVGSAVQAR
jgi:hypothetical protein